MDWEIRWVYHHRLGDGRCRNHPWLQSSGIQALYQAQTRIECSGWMFSLGLPQGRCRWLRSYMMPTLEYLPHMDCQTKQWLAMGSLSSVKLSMSLWGKKLDLSNLPYPLSCCFQYWIPTFPLCYCITILLLTQIQKGPLQRCYWEGGQELSGHRRSKKLDATTCQRETVSPRGQCAC